LGTGAYQHRIAGAVAGETGSAATSITGNPELTRRLLDGAGIPVSSGIVVRDVDDAVQAARRLGYPVVLEPYSDRRDFAPRRALDDAQVRTALADVARQALS
jgi:cyanophycin synthetase